MIDRRHVGGKELIDQSRVKRLLYRLEHSAGRHWAGMELAFFLTHDDDATLFNRTGSPSDVRPTGPCRQRPRFLATVRLKTPAVQRLVFLQQHSTIFKLVILQIIHMSIYILDQA